MFSSSSEGLTFFIFCIVFLIALLGTVILVLVYHHQKTRLNHNSQIEASGKKHKQTLLESQLEMQQQTFTNISRRIHSSVGIRLESIEVQLSSLDFTGLEKVRSAVQMTVSEFSQVIGNLSDITRSMSSEILKYYGLAKTLEFELEIVRKSKIYETNLQIVGESGCLSTYVELVIFRIIQEGLNNVVKHANGTKIILNIFVSRQAFKLELFDNGFGFKDPLNITRGFGLTNVENRVRLLKGTYHLYNQPSGSRGAAMIVDIPLTEEIQSLTMTPFSELKKIKTEQAN